MSDDLDLIGHDNENEAGVYRISTANSEQSKMYEELELNFYALKKLLTRHRKGQKCGTVFSPAIFNDGRRNNANVVSLDLIVFDLDRGQPEEEIVSLIKDKGYAAFIVSSHSNGVRELKVSITNYERLVKDNPLKPARDYMLSLGYIESVAHTAGFDSENGKTIIYVDNDGARYVMIRHMPCPKFRVILFPAMSFRVDRFSSPTSAAREYRRAMSELAMHIGLIIDHNATDLAHIYYLPRADDLESVVSVYIQGKQVQLPVDYTCNIDACKERRDPVLRSSSVDFSLLEQIVRSIKNDARFNDRREFVKIFAAIKHATEGSKQGWLLAEEWGSSWTGGDTDPEANLRTWDSINDNHSNPATVRTLIYYAKRDGWGGGDELGPPPHGDAWNGQLFADKHRDDFVFVSDIQRWRAYEGVRWLDVSNEQMLHHAKCLAVEVLGVRRSNLKNVDSSENQKLQRSAAGVLMKIEKLRNMLAIARTEQGMSLPCLASFDADPYLLCVKNGVISLNTRKFFPSTPALYLSKSSGASYDPNARAPRFIAFLEMIIPSREIRDYLQSAVGYSLSGVISVERFFFLLGTGGNGKSVFSNIIRALMGDYATTVSASLIVQNRLDNESERHKAKLIGARMGMINEVPARGVWNDSVLKELTSSDELAARMLRQEVINFFPTHKLWIRGNHMPEVKDTTEGFWRRFTPIPFTVQIHESQRIAKFDSLIVKEELSGVLNWAIEGYEKYLRNPMLVPPKEIAGTVDNYRNTFDTVQMWLDEYCDIAAGAKLFTGEGHESYARYCDKVSGFKLTLNKFSSALSEKGFQKSGDTSKSAYYGVKLREF